MAPRKRRGAAATKTAPPADDTPTNNDPSDSEPVAESEPGQGDDAEMSNSEEQEQEQQGTGAQEQQQQQQATSLKFTDSLMGRPGRPIPVATLLTRLQKLSDELKSLDQDVSEEFKEACRPVAKELGDSSILAHKDKGVRAFAAQCIVDLLALCAPDAPFSLQQLRAIFEMFIRTTFPALADPSNPYNLQHIYVLESLANIKSILLISDLPNANKLTTQLFTTFFDIYSGTAGSAGSEPVSKHVEYTMLNALVTLVDEAESLPQEVIDIVIAQFLRADPRTVPQKEQKAKKGGDSKVDDRQTTLIRQELPTPYIMARDICNTVPDKMAREVSKYFSEVIMDSSGIATEGGKRKSGGDVDDVEEGDTGLSEEDLNELQKAHRLVRELWRACPAVLQSVIPQLEAELSAENVQLRVLATETLGDLISGIGAAGPPAPLSMDAATYPPLSLSRPPEPPVFDPMTTPKAPQPFSQAHPQTYQSFLGRRQDKALSVRASWTTAAGRILATNAGGVGLGAADEKRIVEDLARMLNDSDEKVRLAAVRAVASFNCVDVVNKLGSVGGVDKEGSVLNNLAVHIKDKKASVRSESMTILARLWGLAHGEIAEGNEEVIAAIGGAPSHLLNTYYTNNVELFELLDVAIFEQLLPLNYPPIKSKSKDKEKANGSSQRVKDSQQQQQNDAAPEQDADAIRAERILLLVNGLDERAKKVFYSICARQNGVAKYLQAFLLSCEAYNGGVMDKDEAATKDRLSKLIKFLSEFYPDVARVSADLWKFARLHDRRSYQLIKFCLDAKSDYKTVRQAVRELGKRLNESSPGLMDTLTPLIYRAGLMIYNRSHVPAILSFSKTNEKGLAATAHEILKDMSSRSPEVLETHIREMCQSLQDDVPSASKANNPTAVDNLKACAAFARKFPQKLPEERKFIQALSSYTTHGSPAEVGKHAVSIIMAASPKKEAAARDITQRCLKGFKYGEPGFLTRLASLSQLMLLAPKETEASAEAVFDIALKDILGKTRSPALNSGYEWDSTLDDECMAKMWATKIIVNRIRSHPDAESLPDVAAPVYNTLSRLVANEGELSAAKDTPAKHKPQLRLLAANSILKLSRSQRHDNLLDPVAFEKLAEVAQDGLYGVRGPFIEKLRKYLSRNSLPPRFYTIPFLLAYEPENLKHEMTTWLKHRTRFFAAQVGPTQPGATKTNGKMPTVKPKAPTTMEVTVTRLLSLLAHHPDYDQAEQGLHETAQYIIFYLTCVATAENVSLIYHLAQRVKAHNDAVFGSSTSGFSESVKAAEGDGVDFDTRLHTLSDLTCAAIRSLVEAHTWNLQTLPGRAKLPISLFSEIHDHEAAITVAERDFISDGLRDVIDRLVHTALRKKSRAEGGSRKRKSEAAIGGSGAGGDADVKAAKKAKRSSTGMGSGRSRSSLGGGGGGKKSGSSRRKSGRRDWSGDDDDDDDAGGSSRRRKGRASGAISASERRKSGRASSGVKYHERDDDEDDKEMLGGVAEWEYENGERWREQVSSSEGDEDDEEGDGDDDDDDDEDDGGAGSEENAVNEDVDMAEAEGEDGEGAAASSPPPPPAPSSTTRTGRSGRATPKGRSSTAASATAAGGRAAGKAASSSSPAAGSKVLPTRSGRATRSAAASG